MIILNFTLATVAFVASIIGGVYFLVLWFSSGKKHVHLLYWAFAFSFLFLFKLPNIIANANITLVQHDLYPFFFITLLLYLLAYFLFVDGLSCLRSFLHQKVLTTFSKIVLILASLYFFLSFFVPKFDVSYAPVWFSHVLFFIPAQIFLFLRLQTFGQESSEHPGVSKKGILFAKLGSVMLFVTSVAYILVQTDSAQRIFWYASVVSSPWISFLQIVAVVLLFFGFRAMALTCLQTNK